MLLPLLLAANPIFTDTFTSDPAPIVDGDTCYVITPGRGNSTLPAGKSATWKSFDEMRALTWNDPASVLLASGRSLTCDFGFALY